jgi:hypothetical protein
MVIMMAAVISKHFSVGRTYWCNRSMLSPYLGWNTGHSDHGCRCFPQFPKQMPVYNLYRTTTASFQILSSSSFTHGPDYSTLVTCDGESVAKSLTKSSPL